MGRWDFNKTDTKVKESWAIGVEWELTRMKYPSSKYKGRTFNRSNKEYTLVVPDMIDNNNTNYTNYGFTSPQDNVSGYSIRQIEDALRGKHKWHTWRDNIKNRYNNSTEGHLNNLFAAYE